MTQAQMKARYRRTFAGFLWVALSPIVLYAAQSLVFRHILRIDVPNYGLFLLGGLLPWIFIMSSLEMGIPGPISSRELLLALKVKPYLLVFSSLFDNAFNFVSAFLIVLVPTILIQEVSLPGVFLFPLALVPLLAGTAGLLWFLAVANVFYRDVRFLVHFAIGVLFFLTPIFYPKEFVPAQYRWMVEINPLYVLIEPLRLCVHSFTLGGFALSFVKAVLCASAFCILGRTYWGRRKNEFYLHL